MTEEQLLERIAELCHKQWSDWMKYFLNKCHYDSNGDIVVHREYISNLELQINADYKELSEIDKEKDRREANKFLSIFREYNDKEDEESLLSEYGPDWARHIGLI